MKSAMVRSVANFLKKKLTTLRFDRRMFQDLAPLLQTEAVIRVDFPSAHMRIFSAI